MAEGPSVDLGIPGLGPATRIGSGGFADVYRATQLNLRREVAVKVLRTAANDAQGKMRFERECHAVGAVSGHPSIVGVHEGGFTPDGRAYLVMEYCPGGSLLDRLERDGAMLASEVIEIGQKIGRALAVAHDAGVLHRDVKPANILLTAYDEPALADFGIARVEGGQQTATGLVTASLAHAAPEVLNGGGPTAASDVYSLGSTLFELAVGSAPHHRNDEQSVWALMNRVISDPVPDPASLRIPEPLATTIRTATAKEPGGRYGTVAQLVTALSANDPPPAAPAPSNPTTPIGSGPMVPPTVGAGNGPTSTFDQSHHESTVAMPSVTPAAAPGVVSTGAAPPTVPTPETPTAPAGSGGWSPPPAGTFSPGDSTLRPPSRPRRWPYALAGVLLVAVAVGVGAALWLLGAGGGDDPPVALAFEFPAGTAGPLDAGETYDLAVAGAGDGTLFRYVVAGAPVGDPAPELPPFVPEAGRYSMAVEVTQGDSVVQTDPVELYVIDQLPDPGFRANLASVSVGPGKWASAINAYDRLVEDGHTDLQLLPSDRFPSLTPGFWNLFVAGFGDQRAGAIAYCEEFGLEQPGECFVSFFDPGA